MKRRYKLLFTVFVILCVGLSALAFAQEAPPADDPLPSWNDTPNKERIIAFAQSVSDPYSAEYVKPEERVAAFDLDGTLFCEKPMYVQVLVAAARLYDLAKEDQKLRKIPPYKAAWENDTEYLYDSKNFLEMNLTAFQGATEEEYKEYVKKFLSQDHPVYKVPYLELFYVPMLELLRFLNEKEFKIFLVSGSPQEFIRAFSEKSLDVELERVIGDTISVEFNLKDNEASFVRKKEVVEPEVLREGKAVNVRLRVGRKPLLAFGNSNDDIAMLQYASSGEKPYLSGTVHHDDAEREYAYDKGADRVLDAARENNWVTVSMKDDFKKVFGFQE